jgi:formate dehydrogenase subunit gamma
MNTDTANNVQSLIEQFAAEPGGLLPLLHEIQELQGHIPEQLLPDIAQALNLSRADVHGVISFYEDFSIAPKAQHRLQICCAEACQAVGAFELKEHLQTCLGIEVGESTPDGAVAVQAVYCLGNCASGPSVSIDGQLHARVSTQRLDELLEPLISGEPA